MDKAKSMVDIINLLSKAIYIASDAHKNQLDKAGKPYILHPIHLMNKLLYDTDLAIIAVLHDVVEDTHWTIEKLKDQGFSERVIIALDLLTHKKEHSYEEYIDLICQNIDAITVKRKDLEHNSDITRLKGVSTKDLERIKKYHLAFVKLGAARYNFNKITL